MTGGQYDVLLVVGAKKIGMSKVTEDAHKLKLPEEKLLGDWIVCILGFTLDKYRHLQQSNLSIFSMNCFGGCISHMLCLPFRSPFVNLFLSEKDFLKFLSYPSSYIKENPIFERLSYSWKEAPDGYPILSLKDILLNGMHYRTANGFISQWNERKQRINWDNLFVVMFTQRKEILEQFDELPYDKKVCFVPFKSDLNSAFYIDRQIDNETKLFVNVINNFGWGRFYYYDIFDMLLYGKKTPLIDM